jgi:hypothetical protein
MPPSSQPAPTTASPVTAATPDLSAPVTAAAPDLSARITQSRIASDKYVDLLIVVDDGSGRSFESTRWSCQFFNDGEPRIGPVRPQRSGMAHAAYLLRGGPTAVPTRLRRAS